MQIKDDESHSKFDEFLQRKYDELIENTISALKGKASDNNRIILTKLALHGPMLKYDISIVSKIGYSTVSRRVDDLKNRGYLSGAGTRTTNRGTQSEEILYGLTWRGLIASQPFFEVRDNLLQVLEVNPLLAIPEKDFVIQTLSDVFPKDEFEIVARALLMGLLESNLPPIDTIPDDNLRDVFLPAFSNSPAIMFKTKEGKSIFSLLDNPVVLQYVKDNVVTILLDYEKYLLTRYQQFKVFSDIGRFILKLDVKGKPSEKMHGYLDARERESRSFKDEVEKGE